MFTVNDDLSIYLTRGDTLFFNVRANDHGYPYTFKPGDIVRISVTAKKDVTNVFIQKDFPVYEACKTVFIHLEGRETKIGEKINKYKDYWYEIVLNPDTAPMTIIGNNDEGAKILRLFPEADDLKEEEILPEEIPVVDAELDLTSNRPVSNRAVAAAVARLTAAIEELKGNLPKNEEPDGSVFNARGQVEGLCYLAIDAYGIAVKNGFEGTVDEWLDSLHATDEQVETVVAKYMRENNIGSGSGGNLETVLSDNLLDKSLLTRGQGFYYGSSGYQFVSGADIWYGYIPLRGAGTYRTKFMASTHSSTAKRIALVNDNNEFVVNVVGSHGEIPTDNTRNWLDYEFTVTQAHIDAGATKIAFDVWTLYMEQTMIVKDREYPAEYIPYGYIEVATDSGRKLDNLLSGKTAVFLGDSICAGDIEGSEYDGYGWAGLIGEANGMTWKNYGRNGGTIVQIDDAQFERWLTTQLVSAQYEYPNADYVIFEGGTNDAFQLKEAGLGVVSDDFATFDISTFSGAMESLILKIITAYPNAQIGYIVAQKMGNPPYTSANIQRKYFDRAVEICQKWGIPVIDLWNGGFLNPAIPYHAETFYVDGQHLTLAGYQRISPQIEAWMRNMTVPGVVPGKGETPEVRINPTTQTSQSTNGATVTKHGVTIAGPRIVKEDGSFVLNQGTVWDGKSAYEYAREAGYTGTEEEFAEMMANGSVGSGGNVELPEVTEADDGKFLRVSGGAWAAVAIDNAEGVSF